MHDDPPSMWQRWRDGSPRTRRRMELLTATLALAAGLVGAGAVVPAPDWVAGRARTSIESPSQYVDNRESLSGALGTVPADHLVWAATRDESSGRFHPQNHACARLDDTFDCGDYWIGPNGPAGDKRYTIYVLAAPASAASAFLNYQLDNSGPGKNEGMRELPADVEILATLVVIRKPS